MTRSEVFDTSPPTFDAGAEYARQLRDPRFRAYLARLGKAREHVVIALDDEPFTQVVARMEHNGTASPCIIAIRLPSERFGFGILIAEKVRVRLPRVFASLRRERGTEISPSSSIGMLYAEHRRTVLSGREEHRPEKTLQSEAVSTYRRARRTTELRSHPVQLWQATKPQRLTPFGRSAMPSSGRPTNLHAGIEHSRRRWRD